MVPLFTATNYRVVCQVISAALCPITLLYCSCHLLLLVVVSSLLFFSGVNTSLLSSAEDFLVRFHFVWSKTPSFSSQASVYAHSHLLTA